MADEVRRIGIAGIDDEPVALRDISEQIGNVALDGRRGDAMFGVVFFLPRSPPVGFADGTLHAAGHMVGIQDDPAIDIACGASDRLDKAGFRAQETFLVGIEDRHQPAFGNIEPFAQQVDAHQHVIDPKPQVADQFDTLQCFDIAVHVAHPQAGFVEKLGQILGHALGQRRHQRAIAGSRNLFCFLDQIFDLVLDRFDLDRRIDKSGRPDHLFHEHAAGLVHLPRSGRGRDEHRLRAHRLPFGKAQRAVVDARRQAKAIFGERELAAVIALGHRADLADGDMAFIDEQHGIFGQIFEQGRRWFAGQAAGEEAAVILDTGARTRRCDHFEIEIGALFEPLRLEQFAFGIQLLQPLGHFEADRLAGLFQRRAGGHIV